MQIISASSSAHIQLTALTLRSKSYWGYTDAQIEEWRETLTITEEYIKKHFVFCLVEKQTILGYYSFIHLSENNIELDNFFLEPTFIGKGLGDFMLKDFLAKARLENAQVVQLYADPNVASFYEKYGFTTIGQFPSSIPNRSLPIMKLNLLPLKA